MSRGIIFINLTLPCPQRPHQVTEHSSPRLPKPSGATSPSLPTLGTRTLSSNTEAHVAIFELHERWARWMPFCVWLLSINIMSASHWLCAAAVGSRSVVSSTQCLDGPHFLPIFLSMGTWVFSRVGCSPRSGCDSPGHVLGRAHGCFSVGRH